VRLTVEKLLGPERQAAFSLILAGDVVSKKKPDPEIYNLAKGHLRLTASDCLVIEDSRNGLLAAKAAGMHCIVTTSSYTLQEDFREADAVFAELGDPPGAHVTLTDLRRIVAATTD
jgi:beta-phosphoglucomutase-like phosphatase (HAD superfamily)